MENLPIRDGRIIEAIEVCRPGRDDAGDPVLTQLSAQLASDPELAEQFERLQRLDANLGAAFQDVPVPEGLDQRLLARLEAARAQQITPESEDDVLQAACPTAVRTRRVSRRWLLVGGGVASVAAVLAIAATIYLYNVQPYTESSVLVGSLDFFKAEPTVPGNLVRSEPPPEAYPFSRAVGRVPKMRWRPIRGFLGRAGVAYEIPVCERTTLYVVQRKVADLAARPPLRPQRDTGGYAAAAWQEGDLLYVLVVHGNNSPAVYRGLIDLRRGPLL